MSSIDNRIVQMEFDNASFEKGVSTSLGSISKLDESINNLEGSHSLSGLTSSISSVSDRFSDLGIIGMTVIQNITDKIVDLGLQMAKSLTVDQLSAGLSKYEAITTSTIAIVNQADISYEKAAEYIEKLAWYSDVTSFDLNSMVSSLKSFAAQGLDLDESIDVIMGIGNAVTYAGQSAKVGSGVFDIYAKAISAGYLSYMQWFQLSKTYGVGTAKLKQQIIDAAVAVGTLTKEEEGLWVTENGTEVTLDNFQTTLSHTEDKWATTAVLMKVFGDEYGAYASELADSTLEYQNQTGEVLTLTEAMEKFGDEADEMGKKYLLSATIARTFTEAVDSVKDAVSTQISNVATEIFGDPEEAMELWTEFGDFLNGIFVTPFNEVANLLAEWNGDDGKGRSKLIESIKTFYTYLTATLKPLSTFVDELLPKVTADGITKLTDNFSKFVNVLKNGLETSEEFKKPSAIDLTDTNTDGFSNIELVAADIKEFFDTIVAGMESLLKMGKQLASKVIEPIKELGYAFKYAFGGVVKILEGVSGQLVKMEESGNLINRISSALEKLNPLVSKLSNALIGITDFVVNFVTSGPVDAILSFIEKIYNWISSLGSVLDVLKGIVSSIIDIIKDMVKNILSALNIDVSNGIANTGIFQYIFALIYGLQMVQGVTKSFKGISWLLNIVDFLKAIPNTLKSIASSLKSIVEGNMGSNLATQIRYFAITMLILAGALLVLSSINPENLAMAISAMTIALIEFVKVIESINAVQVGQNGLFNKRSGMTDLIKLSAALLIVAMAIYKIGQLGLGSAIIGVVAISIVLWELVKVMKVTSTIDRKKITNFISLALSLLIIAIPIKMLGSMEIDKLIAGEVAVIIMIDVLTAISERLSKIEKPGKAIIGAASLLMISLALIPIAAALFTVSLIPWEDLAKSFVGLAATLGAIVGALYLMSKIENPGKAIIGATSLLIVSLALIPIAAALLVLSAISWDGLDRALIAMVGSLGAIGLVIAILANLDPGKVLAVSGSILIFAIALQIIATALIAFSIISNEGLIKAGITIAAILVMFGVLSAVLSPMGASLLLVSGALALFGAGLLLVGLGIQAITTGFAAFNISISSIGAVISNLASVIITGITSLAKTIAERSEELVLALVDLVKTIFETIVNLVVKYAPVVWNKLKELLAPVFQYIGEKAKQIIDSVVNFFNGILDNIKTFVKNIINSITDFFTTIVNSIKNFVADFIEVGGNCILGFVQGIKDKAAAAVESVKNVGKKVLSGIKGVLGIASPSKAFGLIGMYSDEGLAKGLLNYSDVAEKASAQVGKNTLSSLSNQIKKVGSLSTDSLTISPKITPVVDLTQVQNGRNSLNNMFRANSLSASISGNVNASLSSMSALNSELVSLKSEISKLSEKQVSATQIANAMNSAMRNVDIVMDGSKVGKMVTSYQTSLARASGV